MDWPANLVEDIARRRAVIIIGSGASRHATNDKGKMPPDWKNFLLQAVIDCPDKDIDHISVAIGEGDYLHACEWLKKRFDEQWTPYLRKIFQQPGYDPGDLHKQIIGLDNRIVFSLNFDDIYERAAQGVHRGSHIVKQYHDRDVGEFLRGDGRYIVKVHGSLSTPEDLIFTQHDYAKARANYSAFYQAFDACLLTHSFLFIGAGHADPDVNLVLENQAFSFPSSSPHYFFEGRRNEPRSQRLVAQESKLKDTRV